MIYLVPIFRSGETKKVSNVFVINGKAGVGKDTFVNYVACYAYTRNYSTIDDLKMISELYFGYDNNRKTDKDRKFLSDFKKLVNEYCDFSFQRLTKFLEVNNSKFDAIFIHCREIDEIKRIKENIDCRTILITSRRDIHEVTNNASDANVELYEYDITIDNSGSMFDLQDKAQEFVQKYITKNE